MSSSSISIFLKEIEYDREGKITFSLTDKYDSRGGLILAKDTEIEICSLLAPQKSVEHEKTLVEYSADLRSFNSTFVSNLDLTIGFDGIYDIMLYSFHKNNAFTVQPFVAFLSNTELTSSPTVNDFVEFRYFLAADNKNWEQKSLFDIKKCVNANKFKYADEGLTTNITAAISPLISNTDFSLSLAGDKIYKNHKHFIHQIYDIFLPPSDPLDNWLLINMASDFYPTAGETPFEFESDEGFFSSLLNRKSFPGLITNQSRSTGPSRYIYHFKANKIAIKDGEYYVTKEFFESVKICPFFITNTANGNISTEVKLISDIANNNQSIIQTLKNSISAREVLVKIKINIAFNFRHLQTGTETVNFNGMLAAAIASPGNFYAYAETVGERRTQFYNAGEISHIENLKMLNLYFEPDEAIKISEMQQAINSFYSVSSNKNKTFVSGIDHLDLKYPWYDYKDISPFNPNLNNITETYFVYQEESKKMYISSRRQMLDVICTVLANPSDAKTILDGEYFANLALSNPIKANINHNIFRESLTFKFLDFQGIPISEHLDINNEPIPFRNCLLFVGDPHSRHLKAMIEPIDSLSCLCINDINGVKNPMEIALNDNDYMAFFQKYNNQVCEYMARVETVIFPTKIGLGQDGNEVNMFLKVKGLDQAHTLKRDNSVEKSLGHILLNEINDWNVLKGTDNKTIVKLVSNRNDTYNPHTAYPFLTTSVNDLAKFNVEFVDESGDLIEFINSSAFGPQFILKIDVYRKG